MSLSDLPVELIQHIGLYAIDSIRDLSQTCRYLRRACQYNGLWKCYCRGLYQGMGLSEREINDIESYRADYWQIQRDNRVVENLYARLKNCEDIENQCRCELITKIVEYGPRARLVLNRKTRSSAAEEEAIELSERHSMEAMGSGPAGNTKRTGEEVGEAGPGELEASDVIGEAGTSLERRWSWGTASQKSHSDWTSYRRRWSSGSVEEGPAPSMGECPSFRRRCSAALATRPSPIGLEAGPQENIDAQFNAEELLSLITRRRILTMMTKMAQDPESFTALDVFFVLNDRFPQQMADARYKTMFDQMVDTTEVPENATPTDILQALNKAQKHLELPIRSSTMIDRRKYKSVVYIFAYCTLLENYGYHAIPYLQQSGLKWQAFIKILNDEPEPYYLQLTNQPERYSESQLDQLVKTCNLRWASIKRVACGFTRIFARLSAPQTVCNRLLAAMEALFETSGEFLQWKTENSIELLNPHDTFRSSQGLTFSAEQMARTFLHILQKWDTTVIVSNNLSRPLCISGNSCLASQSW